jgi:hypothetical protein
MREAHGKYLCLAAVVVRLMLPGFVSDSSAATISAENTTVNAANTTVDVKAHISFERAIIAVGTEPDITFGDVQPRPNDRVMLDTAGNMRLEGKGEVLAPYGRPGVITIGDSRGQILNFLPDNYRQGGGMSSLHARCALKGAENVACDTRPVIGKLENTLFIGMDMTVEDGITPVDNKTIPSFDMSVVYQ